ncbi:MAG TPA: gamma-glutamyl-gamma-aminobutyrate hydrolase family protein [Acidobacteriaceae bacterium]|jgi:putative glutamine amidotransferase
MIPRIAIPVPTSNDQAYNQRSWPHYAEAVSRAGGEPVRVELAQPADELKALIAECQGICLPGSPADVDPAVYGAEVDPASAAPDAAREACDFLLLDEAQHLGKPVLAICFGVQSLNAWRGGPLVQDLTPVPVNHSAGSKVAVAHTVLVPPESLLGELISATPELQMEAPATDGFLRLPVNTSHHQAIASPGEGLRIVARCPDDAVIEAVENDPAWKPDVELSGRPQFLLGVQWHPERSYEISAASRALFARLVAEASAWSVDSAARDS